MSRVWRGAGHLSRHLPRCGGSGVLAENQGLFSLSTGLPTVQRTRDDHRQPCPTCRGTGMTKRGREVKVRIPPGVEDGQTIQGEGQGEAGRNNGPSDDLYVDVSVDRHPLFGRRGRNLTLEVPVTFPEAALGATVRVPTLDEPVSLRIPPGTPSGKTFRVKGRGVPAGKRTAGGRPSRDGGRVGSRQADRRATRRSRAAGASVLDSAPRALLEEVRGKMSPFKNSGRRPDGSRRVRDLGRSRASRCAPADAARLRTAWSGRPAADRRAARAGTRTGISSGSAGSRT